MNISQVLLKDKTNESMSVAGQILAPFLVPGALTFLALFYLLTFLMRAYNRKMSKLRSNDSSYRYELFLEYVLELMASDY